MENKKKIKVDQSNFYSNDMTEAKDQLPKNHLKLAYQKKLFSDLDRKHKIWAKKDAAI